jgi:hypothetical protein
VFLVPKDFTTARQVLALVFPVHQVSLPTFPVRRNVHLVLSLPITVAKAETVRVLIVRKGGYLKKVVLNVNHAKRVNLVMSRAKCVKIVLLVSFVKVLQVKVLQKMMV